MKKITFLILITFITIFIVYYFLPIKNLSTDIIIDRLVVYKSKRELSTYSNGELVKTYQIALGQNPVGDKEFEGDMKTPEGLYYINDKNPNSAYHKNLGISYPNQADRQQAKVLGKPVGGDIKIHGLRNGMGYIGKSHRLTDWTWGCIALTNEEIDELYHIVKISTPIEIYP